MTDFDRPSVTVVPGVPDMAGITVDNGIVPFPDTTTDFVKILKETGLDVRFSVERADRRYVGHKALELWLPILEVSRDVFIAIGGGLLVEAIKSYLEPRAQKDDGPQAESDDRPLADPEPVDDAIGATHEDRSPAILHIQWHVTKPDGERDSFVANGSAPDVLRALEEFVEDMRDSTGT